MGRRNHGKVFLEQSVNTIHMCVNISGLDE